MRLAYKVFGLEIFDFMWGGRSNLGRLFHLRCVYVCAQSRDVCGIFGADWSVQGEKTGWVKLWNGFGIRRQVTFEWTERS